MSKKIWETFDSEGGWSVPIKIADDLPQIAFTLTITDLRYELDDSDTSNRYYLNSYAYVVEPGNSLTPVFDGSDGSLIGYGEPILESWAENWNSYYQPTKREALAEARAIMREVFEDKPDFIVNWLRSEIATDR